MTRHNTYNNNTETVHINKTYVVMVSHPGVPYLIKTLVAKATFEYSFSSQNRKGKPFILPIGDFELFNCLKTLLVEDLKF